MYRGDRSIENLYKIFKLGIDLYGTKTVRSIKFPVWKSGMPFPAQITSIKNEQLKEAKECFEEVFYECSNKALIKAREILKTMKKDPKKDLTEFESYLPLINLSRKYLNCIYFSELGQKIEAGIDEIPELLERKNDPALRKIEKTNEEIGKATLDIIGRLDLRSPVDQFPTEGDREGKKHEKRV